VPVRFDDQSRLEDGRIGEWKYPPDLAVFRLQFLEIAEIQSPVRAGRDACRGKLPGEIIRAEIAFGYSVGRIMADSAVWARGRARVAPRAPAYVDKDDSILLAFPDRLRRTGFDAGGVRAVMAGNG
jgi:hypothetical protein